MTILITGGSGQVGFELVRRLSCLGDIASPGRAELDLSDSLAVDVYLEGVKPSVIVNAAAYTAVDKAESEPELAYRLNASLAEQLAAYASKHQIPLVHFSSDYVYGGEGESARDEASEAVPISTYGRTKLAGDQSIEQSGCDYLILRTSWVYSARGQNFMKTMLRLGRERTALNIVNDQFGAPTPARLIADVTLLALQQLRHGKMGSGLYHLSARGETSWHGFASEIFRLALAAGAPLRIEPAQVAGIPTTEYPTPAARPLNSRLDVSRIEQALGLSIPGWRSQLVVTLAERLERMQAVEQ